MRLRRYVLISLILGLALLSTSAGADVVVLKTGKKFEAEKVWRENDRVWIIFHGMRASIPQNKVVRIERKTSGDARKSNPEKEVSAANQDTARPTHADILSRKAKNASRTALPPQPSVIREDSDSIFPEKTYSRLKWGTGSAAINGLVKVNGAGGPEDVVEYERANENLKLGRANLDSIRYSFWRDKLYMLTIRTLGRSNYTALRDDILRQFGKGRRDDQAHERYLWTQAPNDMMLQYSKDGQQGLLWLRSSKIDRQYKLARMNGHASYLKWMKSRN